MSNEEKLALRCMSDELTDCPSFKGCCDGPEWRGHLCQYHQGWVDGYDACDEHVGKLREAGSL